MSITGTVFRRLKEQSSKYIGAGVAAEMLRVGGIRDCISLVHGATTGKKAIRINRRSQTTREKSTRWMAYSKRTRRDGNLKKSSAVPSS